MVLHEVEVYRQTTHLGDSLAVQTHHNAAKGLIAMLDVKVDLIDGSALRLGPIDLATN